MIPAMEFPKPGLSKQSRLLGLFGDLAFKRYLLLTCLLGLMPIMDVLALDLTEGDPVVAMNDAPEALLISFVVGTSMFVVLTLVGALIVFQRNLNQIRSRLPDTPLEDSDLSVDESRASEMSELITTTDQELSALDNAIESCLQSLRQCHRPEVTSDSKIKGKGAATIQAQQKQIVQYLELIGLQNKKLNTYHQENLKIRNMIQRLPVSPNQSDYIPYSRLRRPSRGLSIRPA